MKLLQITQHLMCLRTSQPQKSLWRSQLMRLLKTSLLWMSMQMNKQVEWLQMMLSVSHQNWLLKKSQPQKKSQLWMCPLLKPLRTPLTKQPLQTPQLMLFLQSLSRRSRWIRQSRLPQYTDRLPAQPRTVPLPSRLRSRLRSTRWRRRLRRRGSPQS